MAMDGEPFQTVSCLDLLETHLIRCFHQKELNYSDRLWPFANDENSGIARVEMRHT
jgi:hypothetical protein